MVKIATTILAILMLATSAGATCQNGCPNNNAVACTVVGPPPTTTGECLISTSKNTCEWATCPITNPLIGSGALNEITIWSSPTTLTGFPDCTWDDGQSVLSCGPTNTLEPIPSDVWVLGFGNTFTGADSVDWAFGWGNAFDTGSASVFGNENTINEGDTYTVGERNTVSGGDTEVVGEENIDSSSDDGEFGQLLTITSSDSYALGENSEIDGSNDISVGTNGNLITGDDSYAIGEQWHISGSSSMGVGFNKTTTTLSDASTVWIGSGVRGGVGAGSPELKISNGLVTLNANALLIPPSAAIASLPAWASGLEGAHAVATNCNAGCVKGNSCTAGGSTHCEMYYNSSALVETGN